MRNIFYGKIQEIIKKDSRYKSDAYEFMMQALWFTQRKFKKKGHVSGRELLGGIRIYALDIYGPMARTVFAHWGVTETADFGNIVFNMIEQGLLNKTSEDSLDDFKDVYDFSDAFDAFKDFSLHRPAFGQKNKAAIKSQKTSPVKPALLKPNLAQKNFN
ncbi:MAG: hypothetical protein MUF05_06230 [Candidatus Omnitrophica bacterium]|jgi:uncharacterized repeat protein (TIGR04138 family)|nr:hypothetical protein [Candidatus Omnitrophota bacterium]